MATRSTGKDFITQFPHRDSHIFTCAFRFFPTGYRLLPRQCQGWMALFVLGGLEARVIFPPLGPFSAASIIDRRLPCFD